MKSGRPERLVLKTYSHLEAAMRMPSEYELVTSRLAYYPERGFEVNVPLAAWYAQHQRGSPLVAADWEAFCDPRETTYASYTALQRRKEEFLDGLSRFVEASGYDDALDDDWCTLLDRVLAPMLFPFHGLQMVAAYVGQMAPSGRITVAALFQAADEIRRVQRIALRTRELQRGRPRWGVGAAERWQADDVWQPLRRAVEYLLVAWDWGEAFCALNLCLKPALDVLFLGSLADAARSRGDLVLAEMLGSFEEDSQWQRAWSHALVRSVIEQRPQNAEVLSAWARRWLPFGVQASQELASLLPGRTENVLQGARLKLLEGLGDIGLDVQEVGP